MFLINANLFQQLICPFLKPATMEMCILMPQLTKWKKNAFTLNSENIKQMIGIQVTLHIEIKLQKIHLQENMAVF